MGLRRIYKIWRTDHHLIIENGHNLKSYLKDVNDENMNYDTFDKDVNDNKKLVIFHTNVNDEYRKSDTFDKDCQQYKDGRYWAPHIHFDLSLILFFLPLTTFLSSLQSQMLGCGSRKL